MKRGDKTRIGLLRKLAKDERLHPNRRLLAILLLSVIEGQPYCLDILKQQYGTPERTRWNENTEEMRETPEEDKLNKSVKKDLQDLWRTIEGENGEPTESNSSSSATS